MLVSVLQPVAVHVLVVSVVPLQEFVPQFWEVEEQVPTLPVRAQLYWTKFAPEQVSAVVQAVSQQTPSAQKPLEHIEAAPSEASLIELVEQAVPLPTLATHCPEALQ